MSCQHASVLEKGEMQRQIIQQNYADLIEQINTDYVLPLLVQEGALTLDMASDIKNAGNTTKRDRNQRLLELIICGGDPAFKALVKSLKTGSKQNHLADVLSGSTKLEKSDENKITNDVNHSMLNEMIPEVKLVFVAKIISTNFYQVGLVLGVPLSEIDVVDIDHHGNSERQAIAMLKVWRMLKGRNATWEKLIKCLKSLELNLKADEVFHLMTSNL
ncbi:uncharacterized protein [Ptychodera flava]|uniref:uncharacterized protein n=1 Tax=Ptychodera flava TaxID=63121 RepID=UPI00396A47E3